ncbi:MAG TPA: tetratricopeptide repeat protein [Sphingobium sp.]|uniref:tetratricopeptide repeat protein n=1 Tax=Sphingobium sp. TaxID=1912891 RepID=UPI002ED3DE81
MVQDSPRGWRASRLLLMAAAAIAIIAVVYAVTRGASTPPAPAAPPMDTAASTDPEAVIHGLQDQVGANPNDSAAWARLGQAYFLTERYADAERAYRRAASLTPDKAAIWSAYGEAAVMASPRDPMPQVALDAFRKANQLDPKDPRSRYFLGVARDLSGDHKGAVDDWLTLLADTPQGAPWEADLRRTIEQVGKINRIEVESRIAAVKPLPPQAPAGSPHPGMGGPAMTGDPIATGAIPGPSREQMQAASSLPKGAQDQMVAGMVNGLEAKLKANPGNVDGWIMLMRSRMTLGETAKATAARDAAIAANPGAAARIRGAASTLGLPGS